MHHILLTRTIPTLFGTAALVAAVVGAVIQTSPFSSRTIQIQNAEPDEENAKRQIAQILTRQTAAWNEGDLEKFMATYWKSKDLTFSGGGKTTRGWQGTLDRYRSRYAPPNEMGKLHFDKLEISIIEKNAALVLGEWHLKMNSEVDRDGNFTLVCRKILGEWKIIHDHSSTLEQESNDSGEGNPQNIEQDENTLP